jgi:hypothetical protein
MSYFYVLKWLGHKPTTFQSNEDLQRYIKENKIPYEQYIVVKKMKLQLKNKSI